ncbi:MAG TPA: hypothetical protein VMT85_03195 [Thermoanaerobaculia bacterium]|nr:hypothetical protein [Thermoanaerobaculia bacterium]
MSGPTDLVARVVAGDNKLLVQLAADGVLPLPPEHLIPLQVHLATTADGDVGARARARLDNYEVHFLVDFIETSEAIEVVNYLARSSPQPSVVEAALRRRDLPTATLIEVAATADEGIQEIILLRQDLIVEEPKVLEALERNPQVTNFTRRRIAEIRRDVLGMPEAVQPVEDEAPAEELDVDLREVDDEAIAEAIEAAREHPSDGELDEQTGLSEGQVRSLPVAVRLSLARGATRTLRGILVRDSNPLIAIGVLRYSAITESEIELVAKSRSVIEDVLMAIANDREWMKKYRIVHNLVCNPRTPPGVAVRLLPRLSIRDLGQLRFDRGVSDAVRHSARRMYETKTK